MPVTSTQHDTSMRVSRDTDAVRLASAIAHCLRAHAYCDLTAIGPEQGYIALKACTIAQTFVANEKWALVFSPDFFRKPNERRAGETLTGILLRIRRANQPA